ncbi:MAG: hypothetical protein U9N13_00425 [Euryarchaeota archaeon]|nr:hypothetical protein [Euryarchaeota archaeon]
MTIHETIPEDLKKTNRQTVVSNLKEVHTAVDKLIHQTYRQKDATASSELREIRSKVTSLLSEMENADLDTFSGGKGSLGEFYDVEEQFIKNSARLQKAMEDAPASGEGVDTFSLDNLVDELEESFNKRVILTMEHLLEYRTRQAESLKARDEAQAIETETEIETENKTETIEQPEPAPGPVEPVGNVTMEMDTETLSRLYNYINILEQKYSKYHPDISNNGNYIANKTWKIEHTNRSIHGVIKDGMFKAPLVFETFWHPRGDVRDIIKFVQSKANAVGKKQYISLCLVNDVWDRDIKEWAKHFTHQRLVLYLYELETDMLIVNGTLANAELFGFWHSKDLQRTTLAEEMKDYIDEVEYFTVEDVANRFGLNMSGSEDLLEGMVKKGIIVDVGFGGEAKYTKAKQQ